MQSITVRLDEYIKTHAVDLGDDGKKLCLINCIKLMRNSTSLIRLKLATDLKNLRIICAPCRLKTTMQYLNFAAGCTQHTNARLSLMACNTAHISYMN